MPCRKRSRGSSKKKSTEEAKRVDLDDESVAILKALKSLSKPSKCSEIAEKAGLPTRKVTGKLRGLLNKGLVSRPERGLYVITESGKAAVS